MGQQVIMVASGRGGTGKSAVAVQLGARLAAQGLRVLLIELAAGLRCMDLLCGLEAGTVYDLGDVLCGRCSAEKAMNDVPFAPGLRVICAPLQGTELPADALDRWIAPLRERFDVIFLDTAAGMGPPLSAAAQVSDRALLVLTPDPAALRAGRIVGDWLYDHHRMQMHLVLNRVHPGCFAGGTVRDLDECIDTVQVQLLGVIPESAELRQASVCGRALPAGCRASAALDNLACRVCGRQVPLAFRQRCRPSMDHSLRTHRKET